jgi:hypothetical protein
MWESSCDKLCNETATESWSYAAVLPHRSAYPDTKPCRPLARPASADRHRHQGGCLAVHLARPPTDPHPGADGDCKRLLEEWSPGGCRWDHSIRRLCDRATSVSQGGDERRRPHPGSNASSWPPLEILRAFPRPKGRPGGQQRWQLREMCHSAVRQGGSRIAGALISIYLKQ